MTPQESQLLQDFLDQLAQIRGVRKDPEAQATIEQALAQQPDAPYFLVQRAMLLEQALNQAKAQMAQLQGQSGNSLGSDSTWSRTPPEPPRNAPLPGSAHPAQQSRSGFLGGGTGSLLGSVVATAAGVAGGAFLFQGLEGLFGHHGGSFLGQDAPREVVENVTVNNYEGDGQNADFDEDEGSSGDDSSWA
jgi:uncharacterized protein